MTPWLQLALLLAAVVTAIPAYNRGEQFSVALVGLNEPGIVCLRAELVSDCDNEYAVESMRSARRNGVYWADFMVPSEAQPCRFSVREVEYETSTSGVRTVILEDVRVQIN